MPSTTKSLQSLQPLIDTICRIAGVPGVAIGVIHSGVVLHEGYHGQRDVDLQLPVDRDTVFYVGSLTKAVTATALGILVDQGRLEWTTPIHEILLELSRDTELYAAKVNVLDILCHRTGKAWADALYFESNNKILLPKHQAIPTFDYLPQVEPVRSKFMYNNHAYNIAGLVIEKVSGQTWTEFVSENIFTPLGMNRTFTRRPDDENVAAPYNILSDKTPHRLPFCNASNETVMFAGQSVRTSMADLLKYSAAYLEALGDIIPATQSPETVEKIIPKLASAFAGLVDSCVGLTETKKARKRKVVDENPIRQIASISRPYIARPVDSLLEQTCALGWNRTQLPGSLDFGWNKAVTDPFLVLGETYPGRLTIWHGGNMPGTTAAICLLPESETAVIVLQNSLGLCDVADWICQAAVDTVFTGKPAQDYTALAAASVDVGIRRMKEVENRLQRERIHGTEPQDLRLYIGRYFNLIENWFIYILVNKEGQLCLEFLGLEDERYQLRHYHHDTFVWNMSYDETVKRGQYIRTAEYYKIEFVPDKSGGITKLLWRHDRSVPEGEFFRKLNGTNLGRP